VYRKRISKPKYEIVGGLGRFDEADNVQARGELEPDSELWQRYYEKHPELEKQGRALLKLPGMGRVGPPQDLSMLSAIMGTIGVLGRDEVVDGEPALPKIQIEPARASEKIKGFVRHLGADLVKIGPLNQAWVYTHVGRSHHPGKVIGPPIDLPHQHAVVFAIALNRDMFKCAPQLPSILEIMSKYMRLASISVTLAGYLRSLGYSARAHNVSNYQVIIPPVAVDAGIGELSRNGIIITEEYGNAIKMAAVTTNMPLAHDEPVDIAVDEFCQECQLCADYCPARAIPKGDKTVTRGVRKWQLNDMACYNYFWRCGTDCGICLAVCPWSRPRCFPHNAILWGVERSSLFRKFVIRADKILGDRRRKRCPEWLEEQPEVWQEALRPGHPYYRQH
jgi:NAD-dependent dihydropyrimidine dehydrogenase PreA subunit